MPRFKLASSSVELEPIRAKLAERAVIWHPQEDMSLPSEQHLRTYASRELISPYLDNRLAYRPIKEIMCLSMELPSRLPHLPGIMSPIQGHPPRPNAPLEIINPHPDKITVWLQIPGSTYWYQDQLIRPLVIPGLINHLVAPPTVLTYLPGITRQITTLLLKLLVLRVTISHYLPSLRAFPQVQGTMSQEPLV